MYTIPKMFIASFIGLGMNLCSCNVPIHNTDLLVNAPIRHIIMNIEETKAEVLNSVEPSVHGYSDEEVELLALVMLAEAENQSEVGQRLVVSTILNRVESSRFPNTIHGVIYQKNAFESMHNGRSNRVKVTEKSRELVRKELECRTDNAVMYFRTGHYSKYGTPMFKEGAHYFSSL